MNPAGLGGPLGESLSCGLGWHLARSLDTLPLETLGVGVGEMAPPCL